MGFSSVERTAGGCGGQGDGGYITKRNAFNTHPFLTMCPGVVYIGPGGGETMEAAFARVNFALWLLVDIIIGLSHVR